MHMAAKTSLLKLDQGADPTVKKRSWESAQAPITHPREMVVLHDRSWANGWLNVAPTISFPAIGVYGDSTVQPPNPYKT